MLQITDATTVCTKEEVTCHSKRLMTIFLGIVAETFLHVSMFSGLDTTLIWVDESKALESSTKTTCLEASCLCALWVVNDADTPLNALLVIDERLNQLHGLESSHCCGLVPVRSAIQHTDVTASISLPSMVSCNVSTHTLPVLRMAKVKCKNAHALPFSGRSMSLSYTFEALPYQWHVTGAVQ